MADDQHVRADRGAAYGVGDPALLGAGDQVVDEHPHAGVLRPGSERRAGAPARSSTPPRCSTTTPSTRRSSPQTFSTSSASWRPSTKIRLSRATRARPPVTATDPDAVRRGAAGAGRATGAESTTGRPVEQEAGAEREGASLAAPVLEGEDVEIAVDRDDLTAPLGHDLLDHQSRRGLGGCRPPAGRGAPVGGQDVGP